MRARLTVCLAGCLLSLLGSSEGTAAELDFQREVAPVLERHCLRCHNQDLRRGEISLATPDALRERDFIVPGDPDSSYLLELISSRDGKSPSMPREGSPLSEEQVERIREWIAQGAIWPAEVVLRPASQVDREWWSLQPLKVVEPPQNLSAPPAWQGNAIDRFVFARLNEAGLAPSPPADRRSLIRRITYDLTGLPPTPAEVEAFLLDQRPDAYERLVDRLLASPHYGERWGRHWLDVVRFGESRGFERNEIINTIWPFRDYVIRSFNEDKPFDRLVHEHLAGDVLEPGNPLVEVGTAFLVAGPYDDVGNQDAAQAAQIRANTIDEVIRATSEAFLGLTVGCARCHDHKFDAVTQRDYYALYATFAGVRHGERVIATAEQQRHYEERQAPLQKKRQELIEERDALQQAVLARAEQGAAEFEAMWVRPPVSRQLTEEKFEPVPARYVKLVVLGQDRAPEAASGYRIEEFEVWSAGDTPRNVAAAREGGKAEGASRVADDFAAAYSADLTIDGRFGARWIAAGPELTLTLGNEELIDRVSFSSDRSGAAGDHEVATFVSEYEILVSRDGQQWQTVADSQDRRPVSDAHRRHRLVTREMQPDERQQWEALAREIAEVDRQLAAIPALPRWWVGSFETAAGPFHVFQGGDPQRPADEVLPASLDALSRGGASYALPADAAESSRRRALAEWITHRDNPLTPRVLANRIWHYHFGTGLVATPSDFGAMGQLPSHPQLLDWLAAQVHVHRWRWKPLHKLILMSQTYQQSSAYRPQAAAVDSDSRLLWRFPPRRLSAEEIRDTMLSAAGKLNATMGGPGFRLYRYLQDNVATYVPLDEHGPGTYRRSVYHQNARASRIDVLTDFDSPDCAFGAPRRAATTTPLQALTMLNHSFSLDMARLMADRVQREAETVEAQVERAFLLCYARPPRDGEAEECRQLVEQAGLPALCRALLNTSELIYLH